MKTPEIEKMTGAIRQLADAITPTNAAGSHDASGGYVTSHTEAVMGLTAAMQSIASSISDLADAVRDSSANSVIHRPVGIAPCSPTGRRTRTNPTGKYGVPGRSFMVWTVALP